MSAKQEKFIELQEKKAFEEKEEAVKPAAAPSAEIAKKTDGKEAKKPEKKEEKKDAKPPEKKREVVLERIYTVSLKDAYSKPQMKRANVAIRMLKDFLSRHMKADRPNVHVAVALNNLIRARGSGRPLKKVKILATKDKEGVVLAEQSA